MTHPNQSLEGESVLLPKRDADYAENNDFLSAKISVYLRPCLNRSRRRYNPVANEVYNIKYYMLMIPSDEEFFPEKKG
jgi:LytS/YehU family sensor histidine kinase